MYQLSQIAGNPVVDSGQAALAKESLTAQSTPSINEVFHARPLFHSTTTHEARLQNAVGVDVSNRAEALALLRSKNAADRLEGLAGLNPGRDHEAAIEVALLFRNSQVTPAELKQIASTRPVPPVLAAVAISCLHDNTGLKSPAKYRTAIQQMRAAGELIHAADRISDEQLATVRDFSMNPRIREALRQPFASFQDPKPYHYIQNALRLLDSNSAAVRESGVRSITAAPELFRSYEYEQLSKALKRTLDMERQAPEVASERFRDYGVALRSLVECPSTQTMALSFLVHSLQPHDVLRINLLSESRSVTEQLRSSEIATSFFTVHALETPLLSSAQGMGRAVREALIETRHTYRNSALGERISNLLSSFS